MIEISDELTALKDAVLNRPNPHLLAWAGELMEKYPREELPDWVECLANGNPEAWESVIAVTRDEIAAEARHE